MGILFSSIKSLKHCSVCQFYSFLDEFLFLGMIWVSKNVDNPISREVIIIMDMGSKGKTEWNQRKHALHC